MDPLDVQMKSSSLIPLQIEPLIMFELVLEGVDLQNDLPDQAFRIVHHLQLNVFMSVFNVANKR